MKKKMNNKGVTLISIVVFVIVLLILVAISVNAAFGENGLVLKSKKASKLAKDEEILTDIRVKISDYTVNKNWKGEQSFIKYFKDTYNIDAYGGVKGQYYIEKDNCLIFADLQKNISVIAPIWDGTIASGFESGTGTPEDPYVISTPEQLAYLQKSVSEGNTYSDMYFLQTESLALNTYLTQDRVNENSDLYRHWDSIGNKTAKFSGYYFASDHYVLGLYIDETDLAKENQGLFGYVDDGYIRQLHMMGSYVNGNTNVGSICGTATNNTLLYLCDANVEVYGNSNVGGLVGTLGPHSAIDVCQSYGVVSGNSQVGGICGQSNSDRSTPTYLYYNTNYAQILGGTNVGGICGVIKRNTYLEDSGNEGDVIANGTYIGGIAGKAYNWGYLWGCYNKAKIKGDSAVGGVLGGDQPMEMKECHNTGDVEGRTCVGGLMGKIDGATGTWAKLKYSINSGRVTGSSYVGDCEGGNLGAATMWGNYYYQKNKGGINGVDVAGKAEELTTEQFKSADFWKTKSSTFTEDYWTFVDGEEPRLYFEK